MNIWKLVLSSPLATILVFTGCVESTDATDCEYDVQFAQIDPVQSVVVFSLGEDDEEIEPTGTLSFSGGECPEDTCAIRIDTLEFQIPDGEWGGHTFSGESVFRLVPHLADGAVNELGGLSFSNTTFQVTFSGNIDGKDYTLDFVPPNNVGGGSDIRAGVIVLRGELRENITDENSTPSFPSTSVHFLLTGLTTADSAQKVSASSCPR